MAQQLADLGQRGTAAQQLTRRGVAEPVGSGVVDARACTRQRTTARTAVMVRAPQGASRWRRPGGSAPCLGVQDRRPGPHRHRLGAAARRRRRPCRARPPRPGASRCRHRTEPRSRPPGARDAPARSRWRTHERQRASSARNWRAGVPRPRGRGSEAATQPASWPSTVSPGPREPRSGPSGRSSAGAIAAAPPSR